MFYTAGTGITYSMLQAGGSLAYVKGFSPKTLWDDIRRFEATITIAIHGMVTSCSTSRRAADEADNPLRVVYMGPLARHQEFAERFGCRVYTAYGMTEVPVPIVSGLDPEDERSCGRCASPDYELRLVDEHDVPVPVGTPGELSCASLPWTINSGYKNMPEANATAWRNGWFHTGDQFTQDEDGNFFFLDRIKDVIRRRGVNISSYEVEEEVRCHPAVKDVAAVAVKNPDLEESAGDEEVKVAIVLEDGAELDPAELVEFLLPRMPSHWMPRFIEYIAGAAADGVLQGAEVRPARRGRSRPRRGTARRQGSSSSAKRSPSRPGFRVVVKVSRRALALTETELEEFLQTNRWGRLATASLEAASRTSRRSGTCRPRRRDLVPRDAKGRRGRDLAENPRVAFLVDDGVAPDDTYDKRRGAILTGTARWPRRTPRARRGVAAPTCARWTRRASTRSSAAHTSWYRIDIAAHVVVGLPEDPARRGELRPRQLRE